MRNSVEMRSSNFNKIFYRVLWILLILISANGCSVETLQTNQTPTLTPTSTSPPSATLHPTFTPTATIIRRDLTFLPPRTPTATILPSLPTLTIWQANASVLELLESNGGCLLPCWWGITPGETPWNIAVSFLESFSNYSFSSGPENLRGDQSYYYEFQILPFENNNKVKVNIITKKGVVDEIAATMDINLQNILINLGQPAEIWLLFPTYIGETGYQFGYDMIIVYPGIMVVFADLAGIVKDGEDYFSVCPNEFSKDRFTKIWLWDPQIERDITEISPDGFQFRVYESHIDHPTYLKIESSTDYDLYRFYKTFIEATARDCFLSPISLWPEWSGLNNPP